MTQDAFFVCHGKISLDKIFLKMYSKLRYVVLKTTYRSFFVEKEIFLFAKHEIAGGYMDADRTRYRISVY